MNETIDLNFPNLEQKFYEEVEAIVKASNASYIDAVIHWCAQNNTEIEYVSSYVINNIALRAKIQGEAEDLHFLQRIARLPI